MRRIILLSLLFANVCAFNVLVVFPFPGKSHSILGEGYVRLLLEAGHDVTYITPFLMKTHPNLRQINITYDQFWLDLESTLDLKKMLNGEVDMTDLRMMFSAVQDMANSTIMHPNVQKLMLDPKEQFDVIVVEWLNTDLFSGLSSVFNCPYVWSSSVEPHAMILRLIDEIPNTSYTPVYLSALEPPLTFMERVGELLALTYLSYIRWTLSDIEAEIYKNGFTPAVEKRGRKLPPYDDVKFNGSMVLGNAHVSSGNAFRLPQNHISISGYHIKQKVDPLPKELQNIMDGAHEGVIYFSLGTMIKSKTMPNEMKRELLKMFSGLKQTVIWKFEESLPDLPNNVHIVEWAPQQSILAHPNCVLFITHAGLLSTTETLHFGVPIIGIPLFADQFVNINRAVTKGYAIKIDIDYDLPTKLKSAIKEILGNPKYRERVKELSIIYHDRPVTPGQELVHWVEHVAKTRGALHLRSPALHIPWYQKMYLDLIAVIILVILTIYKILIYSVNLVLGKKVVKAKRS